MNQLEAMQFAALECVGGLREPDMLVTKEVAARIVRRFDHAEFWLESGDMHAIAMSNTGKVAVVAYFPD